MKNEKYRIREICGDWALDIPFPGSVVTIFFNSRANAELVKQILIHEDAHPGEAVPFKPSHFPDLTKMAPLTLEQLRGMDGEVVLIGDANGNIAEKAFVRAERGFLSGLDRTKYYFECFGKTYFAYAYQPAHIDREGWGKRLTF